MLLQMAAKKTAKKSAAKSPSVRAVAKQSNETDMKHTITLMLVIIQLIVLLVLLVSIESKLNTSNDQLDEIESKVNALDNFFTNNVPNYDGSGNAPSAAPTAPSAPSAPAAPSVDPSEIDLEGEPFLGDENAPVVVVEYSDYECPFCARFYTQSYPQLKEEYIETGKVRFVFKDFPLGFHQNALPASVSATCILNELGNEKYFEYHDTLFENQRSLTAANLKQWALDVGASESFYDECIADPEVAAEANADMAEGQGFGVSGTPSFLINGNLIVGAQPYEVIKAAIDDALNS